MQFWYDAWPILVACALCGFLASHSYALAVTVTGLQLFISWLAGWFNVMDGVGMAMLALPALAATLGALIGAHFRRRQKEVDAKAFVPPPPPEGWVPKRRRRANTR